ncbi:Release factor glutamine methyltransferase [Chlamydiales bacterium SCGC AG-110-P3]|nr:Release factor glutamine methyltransferase [Chlamydiales bacterium SCGC AG-110-P3]
MTHSVAEMKTVKQLLVLCSDYLDKRGVAQARRCSEELISDVLGVQRLELYMDFDRPVQSDELQRCRQGLRRLGEHEPWQYVKGSVEFYDCTIKIGPDVLIPRHETEILIDSIIKDLEGKESAKQSLAIWDVCCGSGCIGIALKKRFPQATVVLSDVSPAAVAMARDNAEINDVQVEVREGDMLFPFGGETADLIVCNPPYITTAEYEKLDPEVRDYEPKLALVSGDTGIEFYMRLANEIEGYLRSGGKLCLEIGTGQGEAVERLFKQQGLSGGVVKKDWSGHDRFFLLEIR